MMSAALMLCLSLLTTGIAAPSTATPSGRDEMSAAAEKLRPVLQQSEMLLVQGKFDEADKMIRDVYPEASRTPVQSLMLANMLFTRDRKGSYALHKLAAEKLPESSDAQYEWALEQHRAKEYAGALQAYERVVSAKKGYAPAFGMAAECALRTGNTRRAVELWKGSEKAATGTIEGFESLVCEINGKEDPHLDREKLFKKASAKDERAAADLLLLDAAWPFDWWNIHANKPNLENDLKMVTTNFVILGPGAIKEAKCVAECALSKDQKQNSVLDLLQKYGYLVDKAGTLPANGKALSFLLGYAMQSGAMTKEDAKTKLGEKILDAAKKTGDAEFFNAAANLYLDTEKLEEIDRLGWEKSHDGRFAASLLAGMMMKNKLKWTSPELQQAIKEFPENSTIAGIAFRVGQADGQPLEPLLVAAIKAEFTKFSSGDLGGLGVTRPRADALRGYFKALSK